MNKMANAINPPKAPESADPTAELSQVRCTAHTVDSGNLTIEKGNASSDFFAFIPVDKKQSHGRKKASLENTKEQSACYKPPEILYKPGAKANNSPAECKDGNCQVKLQSLDE